MGVNFKFNTGGFAEGSSTATGNYSHAEGAKYENNRNTESAGQASHAEGASTYAKADGSHAEGILNIAGRFSNEISTAAQELGISGTPQELAAKLLGYGAHAEGMNNKALGSCSHSEGNATKALANSTHAEGDTTIAFGEASHAEGYNTQAKGNQSHAEGSSTVAEGNSSHAEGVSTIASGSFSHAEGSHTEAIGRDSHAEGAYNKAIGIASHTEGVNNTAPNEAQHVSGKFATIDNTGTAIFQVGIGNDAGDRKDALRIKTDGDIIIQQDNQEIVLQDKLDSLQKQIDGEISSWFFEGTPANNNYPASEWTDNTLKERHLGDTYTNMLPSVVNFNDVDADGNPLWIEEGFLYMGSTYYGYLFEEQRYYANGRCRTKSIMELPDVATTFTYPDNIQAVVALYDADKKYVSNYNWDLDSPATIPAKSTSYKYFSIGFANYNYSAGLTRADLKGISCDKTFICPEAGLSWRWCNFDDMDDSTWHWHKIADSDAVKALQEAAKAQLTADTAMNSKLSLSGGQMTGPISFPTAEDGDQVMLKDGDSGIDLLTYTLSGMQAGMSLYPRSSSVNLGRISNYWNNGYVNTLYSYQINAEDSLSITAINNLVLSSENESLIINANDVTSYTNIYAPAFYETSDIRKKDIKSDIPLSKCYELIDKCQTIIYSLKDQTQEQIGMIAQEIEEFFPEVVATDKDGFKSLAYDRLVVICFKVLKDVIKRLEKLENAE